MIQNNSVNWGHVKRLLPYFILYKKFSFLAVSKKTPSISIWGSRHKICERRALGLWTKRTFSIHKTATCLLLSPVCLGKSFRIRIRKLEIRVTNVAYWDLRNCFLFNCIILWQYFRMLDASLYSVLYELICFMNDFTNRPGIVL